MVLNGINSNYIQPESIVFQGTHESVYTGAITGSLGTKTGQFFFCFDLAHPINVPGSYSVNETNPSATLPSILNPPSKFTTEIAASLVNHANVSSFGNTNQYAGLQLAVWSILYNWSATSHPSSTLGTTSNTFSSSATGAVLTDALGFLN